MQSLLNELALALTSGQEINLVVSVGHVIIWIALSASVFIHPDDHETRISLELQTTVLSNSKHTHSTDPSVHHFITLWETSATISLHQTTVLSNKRVKIVRLYLSCWSLWYFQCFDTCQTAVRHALASDANIIPETSRFLATIPCTRCWSITTKQDPRLQQTDKWQYIHSVTVTSELQQLTNVQHWITVVQLQILIIY